MTSKNSIYWPELRFPPINLYNVPRQSIAEDKAPPMQVYHRTENRRQRAMRLTHIQFAIMRLFANR